MLTKDKLESSIIFKEQVKSCMYCSHAKVCSVYQGIALRLKIATKEDVLLGQQYTLMGLARDCSMWKWDGEI